MSLFSLKQGFSPIQNNITLKLEGDCQAYLNSFSPIQNNITLKLRFCAVRR